MDKISAKVNAKINLNLFITGRVGSMHTLDSLMHSIDLYDTLSMSEGKGVYMDGVPDEKNCLVKLVDLMKSNGLPEVRFDIKKGIPFEGGLGGSSADMAGGLFLVRHAFGVDLSGNSLGSDTTFMQKGGFARVEGVGEKVRDLAPLDMDIVIFKGKGGVNTKDCYLKFDEIGKLSSASTEDLLDGLYSKDFDKISSCLHNDLQIPAFKLNPDVKRVYDEVKKVTKCALMSGSGSSVFGLYESVDEAEYAQNALKDKVDYIKRTKLSSRGVELI